MAYAAWLAQVTGKPYRLPTRGRVGMGRPAQRHAATPGAMTGTPARCNSSESRLGQPSPVGVYPHGATPDGPARPGRQRLRVDGNPLPPLSLRPGRRPRGPVGRRPPGDARRLLVHWAEHMCAAPTGTGAIPGAGTTTWGIVSPGALSRAPVLCPLPSVLCFCRRRRRRIGFFCALS